MADIVLVKELIFTYLLLREQMSVKSYDNGLAFCSADETTLKTMLRANPGYILIKNGTIIEKWSWANLPEKDWFDKLIVVNK